MKRMILVTAWVLLSTLSWSQNQAIESSSVQLVRNATVVITYAGHKILVDPMLMPKGSYESIVGVEKNPLVELPLPKEEITKGVDLILVTHTHFDHFDEVASKSLNKQLPLFHQPADQDFFKKAGFVNAQTLQSHTTWKNISVDRTEAQHGSGVILEKMGKTSGFILRAKNQPTIYIIGDGIWTEGIKANLEKYKPDYVIANTGGAAIPGFEKTPIIMDIEQTITLLKSSGKAKVIAVHMEALDHCHTKRAELRQKADSLNISNEKLLIPQDGQIISLK
ncbi:MBL fold metallo-hydrolase [Siphonobacter sp. BAB-5405]|uniref:MBL fold metallo-hydrolase n=1 Tax=Siphonobacter sp. BAB-5405 TaxID=1864825 RepID=UPI000C7FB2BE|nr:MBL fold metallo-hydrolase [Siphonobacter sp. BAB-5405]PMD89203.1 MBL fold metallo-hydrolase [Siphonobacter sp. BAB-5405]